MVSDHYFIYIQKPNYLITYRTYSNHNITKFKEALRTYDFTDIIFTANTKDAFARFHYVLIDLFEVHFPLLKKSFA